MVNIFVRTAILYMVALFVIRVMGKGELSKLDPFQLVALFMIAELAALPIATPDIAVITGVAAMIGILLVQVILSILSLKSPAFNKIIKGKASIIIEKGVINEKEMRRYRVSIDDLSQQLRIKNFPSIADVEYAILEANGDMSVIPKPSKNPATRDDLGVFTGVEGLPMVLMADGTCYPGNLHRAGLDETALKNHLASRGVTDYARVFLCFIDEKGIIHIHQRSEAQPASKSDTSPTPGGALQ